MVTMRIGALEAVVVSDGALGLDPTRLFGRAPEDEWRALAHVNERGQVPAGMNCLLVRSGERKVLLDTGGGATLAAQRNQPCGKVLQSLAALGVAPGDIDTVVISHAHWDHAGGASIPAGPNGEWVPTFPNATYWFWRGEWEYWSNPDVPDRMPFLDDVLPPLEKYQRVALADSEVEVAPGVRVIPTPGHTPGHQCVALTSGAEMAVYTGDLFHHASQIEHPEWSPLFDVLPELSVESRRKIFSQARETGSLLLTAHLPAPGIARLPASGGVELVS